MKKLGIGILIIVLFGFIGIPYINGYMVEKIVRDSFSNINQMYEETGNDISIEVQFYDRGFFSSQMEWKINFGSFSKFYKVDEIVLFDTAKHGYTNVKSKTSLEKNQWFNTFVNEKLDGTNPVEITTIYKFSGDIESNINLNAFLFEQDTETIEIKPGQLKISMDKGIKHIGTDLTWEGCSVPGKMVAEEVSLHSRLEKISTYIWNGEMKANLGKIVAENTINTKETFELTKVMFETHMDYQESENNISMGIRYGADSFDTGKGPIKDVYMNVGIKNIDAQGYEAFMVQYLQLVQAMIKEIENSKDNPDKVRTAMQNRMAELGLPTIGIYEKLLKKDLEFQISELKATLPLGDIKGQLSLKLKKDMTMAQFLPIMMNPAVVLNIFSLTSNLNIPFDLIGENPRFLSPLYPGMKTGLFIKDGKNLVHSSKTKDGKLYLNNKEVILN